MLQESNNSNHEGSNIANNEVDVVQIIQNLCARKEQYESFQEY